MEARNRGNRGESGHHIVALDGLRGIAVLMVALHHGIMLTSGSAVHDALYRVATFGWIGVDLFFVLSGFLITGILLDTRTLPNYFSRFYIRRALRIFPLYYTTLAVLFYVLPLFHLEAGSDLQSNQGWYWAYLCNVLFSLHPGAPGVERMGHLWSLAVEEQFYLVWPAVVVLLDMRRLRTVCLGALVAAPLLRAAMLLKFKVEWLPVYTMLPTRVDPLAAGALLAIALRDEQTMTWVTRWLRPVAGLSVVAISAIAIRRGAFGFWDRDVQLFGYSAVCGLAGAVVASLTLPSKTSPLTSICEAPWLRWFGRYSYALYVIHFPVMHFLRHYAAGLPHVSLLSFATVPGRLVFALVGTALSAGLANLSWHVIEGPFMRLKRFFPYDSQPEPVPAPQ